jgi:hypothetical protein
VPDKRGGILQAIADAALDVALNATEGEDGGIDPESREKLGILAEMAEGPGLDELQEDLEPTLPAMGESDPAADARARAFIDSITSRWRKLGRPAGSD